MSELARDNLPIWMKKSLRGTDWGILIVLIFSLLASWSLLLQPGLPRSNDSEHYVYRAADYARAFAEGRLYPRWSPDALNGYGAPIPHFYPPAPAYLPALITVFITGDATQAVKLVYTLALIGAGAAVYAFVTRRSGAAAGVVAALLYVYSPYVGLTAPHLLGDLPGTMSLALIPALLWSVDRLLRANRPLDLLYVTLITAALLLTDVGAGAAGWALAAALVFYSRPERHSLLQLLIGGALGLLIAACYWLPALVEAGAVTWYPPTAARTGVITLLGLFTPLARLDDRALVHLPQFTLGLAMPLFTLASLPLAARQRGLHRLFLPLGAALAAAAVSFAPSDVGLMGVITLCFSVGASVVVQWSRSRLLLPILCVLVLGAAAPVWIAPRWAEASLDTSAQAQFEYEQQGFGIAVLPPGDALPSLVAPTMPASRSLITGYREGSINKVDQATGVQVGVLEHGTHYDRLQVQSFAASTLNILTADFPGWSAEFSGVPVAIQRSDAGLMQIDLAANTQGELALTLETTTPRALAWIISWAGLLLLVLSTAQRLRNSEEDGYLPLDLLTIGQARLLAALLLGFVLALALFALPSAPLAERLPPQNALAGSLSLDNETADGLQLLAYSVAEMALQPEATLDLTLYWQATQPLNENYQVRVSLLDLTTGAFRQRTLFRQPGGFPTMRWLPFRYVPDAYTIALSARLPAGSYSPTLEVCPVECTAATRLNFTRQDGEPYGAVLVLPIVLTVG